MAKQFDPRFAASAPRFMGRPLYSSPNFGLFVPTLGLIGERHSISESSIPVPGGDTHFHPHKNGLTVTTRTKDCGEIHDNFDRKGRYKGSDHKL